MFSFLGFLGKLNEEIFIFNNYLFVPLIAKRFPENKYNEIFSDFDYYFHGFGNFFMGIFFEAKFYVFTPLLLYYPIKYKICF